MAFEEFLSAEEIKAMQVAEANSYKQQNAHLSRLKPSTRTVRMFWSLHRLGQERPSSWFNGFWIS